MGEIYFCLIVTRHGLQVSLEIRQLSDLSPVPLGQQVFGPVPALSHDFILAVQHSLLTAGHNSHLLLKAKVAVACTGSVCLGFPYCSVRVTQF